MNNFDLVNALVTSNIHCSYPEAQPTIQHTTEDSKMAEVCFVGLNGDGFSFSINMSYKEESTGSFIAKLKVLHRSIRVYIDKAFGNIPCSAVWSKSVAVSIDIDNMEDTEFKINELVSKVQELAIEAKKVLVDKEFNIHSDAYIVPENYEYVGTFRLMPHSLMKYLTFKNVDSFIRVSNDNVTKVLLPLFAKQGITKEHHDLHCMSCNHSIMGGGVAKHIPTNSYIYFGCTCSETRFSFSGTMEKDMANLEKNLHRMFYLAKKNGMYTPKEK